MAIYHNYIYYPFTLELKINPICSICYAFLAISVVKNLVELNHIPSSSIVLWLAIEFIFAPLTFFLTWQEMRALTQTV